MGLAIVFDPQNGVALLARGARHVAQGLLAAQANAQDLARLHALELKLGAHEGHGTNFAGDVDGMVGRDGHRPATIPRPPAGVG